MKNNFRQGKAQGQRQVLPNFTSFRIIKVKLVKFG